MPRHGTRLRNASSDDFSGSPQLFKAGECFEIGVVTIELAGLFHNFRLRRPIERRRFLCLVEQVDPIVLVAAGRVEHDRHRYRFSRPDNAATDPLAVCPIHDGNQPDGIKSGETNRRACNLGVSGNETRLTYVCGVRNRSHFKLERLGAGRDGHQGGLMVSELRVMPDNFSSLLNVYLSVLPAYLPLLPVPCKVMFWPDLLTVDEDLGARAPPPSKKFILRFQGNGHRALKPQHRAALLFRQSTVGICGLLFVRLPCGH